MAKLKYWRVLHVDNKAILAALEVTGHPYIESGPIITSPIVEGHFAVGETVISKSGTNYTLDTPLDDNDDCEFARALLISKVSANFIKKNKMLEFEQLENLNSVIDIVLTGKKCSF